MVVIGLTGNICSGKSTVSRYLKELGAATIDADEIGHNAFTPDTPLWKKVIKAFGEGILNEKREVDRAKLGKIVFEDPAARDRLNRIMHPAMHRIVAGQIAKLKEEHVPVIVLEAALLIEANWLDLVDQVWVTSATEATMVQRCRERSGLSEEQAWARLTAQMPPQERIKYADIIIDTETSLDEVRAQVETHWRRYCLRDVTAERIRKRLAKRARQTYNSTIVDPLGLVDASVLIPVFVDDGEPHILFTKRTDTLVHHSGQISFPGGTRHDPSEPTLETALRECWEEIGLLPGDVEVLGEMDEMPTYTTHFLIHPFVGTIPYPYEFTANPYEVAEIIAVPVSALMDPANFREEMDTIEGFQVAQYFFSYRDRIIWGATARILKQFLEIAFDARLGLL